MSVYWGVVAYLICGCQLQVVMARIRAGPFLGWLGLAAAGNLLQDVCLLLQGSIQAAQGAAQGLQGVPVHGHLSHTPSLLLVLGTLLPRTTPADSLTLLLHGFTIIYIPGASG